MEKLGKALDIIFALLVLIMLLFSLGTVVTEIPAFGSVANFVTVGWMHLWLPVNGAVFLLTLALSHKNGKRRWLKKLDAVMALASTVISAFIVLSIAVSFKANGLDFQFIPKTEDISAVKTETFTYLNTQLGDLELNVYSKDDGKSGKPVMVYFHGGGWIKGSREDHEYYSKVFVNHGYVVVSADYSLSSDTAHMARDTEDQLIDAIVWVRDNAGRYGGDPELLFLTGGSAGGNLALDVAYRINGADDSSDFSLPRIKAVSVLFPVCDARDMYRNEDLIFGKMSHNMAYSYTGCSPEEDPDLYDSIMPASYLSDRIPPTCIFYGANDTVVPTKGTMELEQMLREREYPARIVCVPYGNHMFEMVDGGFGSTAWLQETLEWFAQQVETDG